MKLFYKIKLMVSNIEKIIIKNKTGDIIII